VHPVKHLRREQPAADDGGLAAAAADGHRHFVNTKELYNKTMNDMQLFKAQGHTVYYLWEHEHVHAKRCKAPLRSVVRVL
jgi:hypothetical protein